MPASLLERLGGLTDPRGRHGRQYGLVPLLGLCLVGILAGHSTLAAIAHFGRLRGHALGFTRGTMPCPNTRANLLHEVDPDHLDRVIGEWLADRHPGEWGHLALGGKVVCGSRDAEVPGTHRLAAYAPTWPRSSPRWRSTRRPTSTRRRCGCAASSPRWPGRW